MFTGYGCHCNQNDNHTLGKGQPVDEIDKICQKMNNAIKCVKMELENCDPNTPYQWKMKKNGEIICGT